MNKLIILTFLIFSFGQLKSQTIEIGQDAEQIKRLVEWTTKDHNKSDSYGNYSSARASWDVSYNNGQIVDVIQCYENQYYINLRMSVNYCKHFIMEYGKLAYTLTQYENVSKEKLIEVYDGLYEERKINNLYFDEEYKHYSKIYLAKNGQATIEWRKAELNQIPSNVRKEIENKQKAKENEEYQQKLAAEKEEQKRLEITSKLYDLNIYNNSAYSSVLSDIKQGISNYFKSSEKSNYYNKSSIPSFDELANGNEKRFRYTNTFNAYYKLDDHSRPSQMYGNVLVAGSRDVRQEKEITNISGNDKSSSLFDAISIRIPTIEVEGYEVMTEARFENISVDYAKGITIVKIKSGNIEFLEYTPDNDLIDKIKEKLKTEPKGKYIVKYEYSKIMGDENLNTDLVKKTTKVGAGWLLLGLLALAAFL
jgi:hypothetical protein